MNILITGANGFIGKNLIAKLKYEKDIHILPFDKTDLPETLFEYCKIADFVFHLAGTNRPNHISEFYEGNCAFLEQLNNNLKQNQNKCPIMLASTIQAELNNPYGISKKHAEDILLQYSKETGAKSIIYRFPNVFGKWCQPNYNSVIATFCYNISHGLPIHIDDPLKQLKLVYIDDVVAELIRSIYGKENRDGLYCKVSPQYQANLGDIARLIKTFAYSRNDLLIPDLSKEFSKKLFSTYITYLDQDTFLYDLKMNQDDRGSFTEVIKTPDCGQISVNISKPGITKGNHWHNTKHEKFIVVSGNGIIRLRNIFSNQTLEYRVDGKELQVVEIPAGYVHSIENTGNTDMVTVIWVNECFDHNNPDTYYMDVIEVK